MMPSAEQILSGLSAIANEWRWLAMLWHVFFAVLLTALAFGMRPAARTVAALLVLPFVSVSVLAGLQANIFNATVFVIWGSVLLIMASRLRSRAVGLASPMPRIAGAAMIAFGWAYPHFLEAASWVDYLHSAPTGLVPCPTISIVVGITLMLKGFESRAWCFALCAIGIFYGAFGALVLGVAIDWVLLAGGVAVGALGVSIGRPRSECERNGRD